MNRLQQGYRLGGRYLLGSRIASGGMGDVWRADDEVLDRTVAVKVLRPSIDSEPVFARRFRDEALYTAGLAHPNIATVYDYGEEDHLAYLVMELVDGEPLSVLVRREGAQPTERVRSVMAQAALALGAAHEAGVVHRDVKPANILLTADGTVKLTDFGIARALDGSGHTQTGEVVGTPHYLSPEQALGEAATGASDLYALGIVSHEMLTGRRPFDRNTPVATALAQVNDPPPPLPEHVTGDLRALVEQCLAKRADERPASARELGEQLSDSPVRTPDEVAAHHVEGRALSAERRSVAAEPQDAPGHAHHDPAPTPTTPVAPLAAPRVRRRRRRALHHERGSVPAGPSVTVGEDGVRRVHWAWLPATAVLAATLAVGLVLALTH
ncbi:serine/threonine-protein kinase, partial [Phycicoccus jejuensis]|uniref:serine/threonine-protein kinase n=1 Tax=Phycicoccus jejuensis TaxID=367299 RepID=UPI0004C399B0